MAKQALRQQQADDWAFRSGGPHVAKAPIGPDRGVLGFIVLPADLWIGPTTLSSELSPWPPAEGC